jgi:transcriptional regulator with XRE-family HTH domain
MQEDKSSTLRTSTLFRRLFKTADIKGFIEKNEVDMQTPIFHDYIEQLRNERGEKKSEIANRASIEKAFCNQLFNGTRKPSRDKVIQLAFGFGLDLEGTQKMLQIAQKSPLYPRLKRDAAIIYCINRLFNIDETQGLLHDLGLQILGEI